MAKSKTSKSSQTTISFRDSTSGRFVTKSYATKHPRTTVKETYKKKGGTDHTGPRRK